MFLEHVANVTVALGRDASLTCAVDNLGGHKVSTQTAHCKGVVTLERKCVKCVLTDREQEQKNVRAPAKSYIDTY